VWFKVPYSSYTEEQLKEIFAKDLDDCWSLQYFRKMFKFCENIKMDFYFIVFEDNSDWSSYASELYKVKLYKKDNKLFHTFTKISICEFKENIKKLSGGAINIGAKGLIYGTSKLECYLSNTTSLYPGDADLVLTNNKHEPIALIEFKKHTKTTPMKNQQISNYYPWPDKRKYDRLYKLQKYIESSGYNIPFFVFYYPTDTMHNTWKLENVKYNGKDFDVLNNELFDLPQVNNMITYKEVVKIILLKIEEWK